jgi:hypothetical protein
MASVSSKGDTTQIANDSENEGMFEGYQYGRPFIYTEYKTDFLQFITDEWTSTLVEGGAGESTITLADLAHGNLLLTCDANENDGINLQLGGTAEGETTGESFAAVASKNLYFETRLKLNDVTQTDFFVGLHVEDTAIIASKGSDYIGFRSDDGDALLDAETSASSSASDTASLATLVDDTFVKLGFRITGTSKIEYWVDDTLTATITSDIPTALMKLSIAVLTGEAVANTMHVDYVFIAQER